MHRSIPAGSRSVSQVNDRIVEAIATSGSYVGPSIIDAALVIALRARLNTLHARHGLVAAQVGRGAKLTSSTKLRGDMIAWLEPDALEPAEVRAMALIDALRAALNEALYIGAMDSECHYSRYPPGTSYKTHLDRFGDHDLRVVSLVFYLNARWRDDEGGELLIHHPDRIERVLPRNGTMVAFLSAKFPHEVLPATRPRLALSGWMRRRPLVGQ